HKLITDEWQLDFAEAVFHLHVFQAMTIELDLLKALESVAETLEDLCVQFQQIQAHVNLDHCFLHTPRVKNIIKRTISVLLLAGGNIKQIPASPQTIQQLSKISALYTMESERVVLGWFIDSIPSGSWEGLMLHYQTEIDRLSTKNAELF